MTDWEPQLRLYNTLTRTKEAFAPIDANNVRMYVCGPTVYDYAHIGNARPAIVFDVLFRLLRHLYGDDHVNYVRNITDVDDKINARALRDFGDEIASGKLPLNEAIRKVTEPTYEQYQKDVAALGCLPPTHQPRATDFVLPRDDGKADMVSLIQSLIERGHAYEAKGESGREILFNTRSMADYGRLAGDKLSANLEGARIEVEPHKLHPADFVLWKESSGNEPGWEARFNVDGKLSAIRGRPGWHIECSAMSAAYLGDVFDIHGGGLDLIFPHHENEIAQSRCAHGSDAMANVWMHNGFLQVEGKKMSKSDGNFITIHELLRTDRFGGKKWDGPVLRLAMLMTHYRHPIDFSVSRLEEAEFIHRRLSEVAHERTERRVDRNLDSEIHALLMNDLDTPSVLSIMNGVAKKDVLSSRETYTIYKYARILGIKFPRSRMSRLASKATSLLNDLTKLEDSQLEDVVGLGNERPLFKSGRLRPEAELFSALKAIERFSLKSLGRAPLPTIRARIRNELAHQRDNRSKSTRKLMTFLEFINSHTVQREQIQAAITRRLSLLRDKNFAEADRIRDELLAQGIQLKDGKDPETGERTTTWEVKR